MKRLFLMLVLFFTTLSSTQVITHGITLSWTNPNSGTTTFNVYRTTTSGGETQPPLVTALNPTAACPTTIGSTMPAPCYNDTSAVIGTKYFYTVTAVVGGIESAPSTEVSAQIVLPTAPSNPETTVH